VKPWEEEKLWVLDSIGITTKEPSLVEDKVYQDFGKNVKRKDKLYEVALPWKTDNPNLTSNYGLAKGRLRSGLRKLHDSNLIGVYNDILEEQIRRGFIEKVVEHRCPERAHYIPHFSVMREHHTTPIRIVFDASSKCPDTGKSLNDMLHTGPSLVPDLTEILLRFRLNKFVCISDISKAFLCVGLREEDRDFTRFLWPSNPSDPDSSLTTFRFRRVLFGATSSPFLLQATVRYHFANYSPNYGICSEALIRDLYVDNLFVGAESEKKLLDWYFEAKEGYLDAGLPLREWKGNSSLVNQQAELDEIADTTESDVVRMLGLKWDSVNDTLLLNQIELKKEVTTKREVLSETCRIFDPLGLFYPVTVRARLLIQKLWKKGYDWDETIDPEYQDEWKCYERDASALFNLRVNRWIFHSVDYLTLHLFADASSEAMGVSAYVVQGGPSGNGPWTSNLLMAKARVAPVKTLTIPKLELTAAVLAVRVAKYILKTFEKEVTFKSIHLWDDSQITLSWILNNDEHKNLYVANRVEEIKSSIPEMIFHHVSTELNPADLLTRSGVKSLLNLDSWWFGPPFLTDPNSWIPYNPSKCSNVENSVMTLTTIKRDIPQVPILVNEGLPEVGRFRSLDKLLRVTSYVMRLGKIRKYEVLGISTMEMERAEEKWIHEHQQICFKKEIDFLQGVSKVKTSIIDQLWLYFENDVLRVKTRLQHANLPESAVNPILLSGEHELTRLYIINAHERTFHGSAATVMAYLRKRFWLPKCRQNVGKILRDCAFCNRMKGTPYIVPVTPALPIRRVIEAEPFQFVGVDYTGHLYVREPNSKATVKCYIALFTCLCTRAVHLEVASDASAEAFARVYRRFVAHQTAPQIIYNDRGSNFLGFKPMLKEIKGSPAVEAEMSLNRTTWEFIPAKAPWFGGFWEGWLA
jgi:hypothetical protein